MNNVEPIDHPVEAADSGKVRAGAAAAARRRELNISQRRLAAEGIINAGALIAFEKGRSWPRERTRAKLEKVLNWPPGMIARLRHEGDEPAAQPFVEPPGDDQVPLIAQAVIAAVNALGDAIDSLPPAGDPDFTPRVTKILADLRQLEGVAARAARISRVSPPLIKALSAVRRRIHDLTMRGASAPTATLGQRLYIARRRADLTIDETAQAAGVSSDAIVAAEADEPVSGPVAQAIEALLADLD